MIAWKYLDIVSCDQRILFLHFLQGGLCKENCALRDAIIVASVLQRVYVPVHIWR